MTSARSRASLALAVSLLTLLPQAGLAQDDLPPGVTADRFDVGGRQMMLLCVGPAESGLPTVIAEAGLGGDSSSFESLVPLLLEAPFRSCAYDRVGLGQSDPLPEGSTVTVADGAEDLHALLEAAGVATPVVLLPWSLGSWYARAFASAFPDEVAGIVFIDPSHPDQAERLKAILPPAREGEDPELAATREALTFFPVPPVAETGWLDMAASAEQVRAAGDLGDLPVVVLTHDISEMNLPDPYAERERIAWLSLQDEIASLSTDGVERVVPGTRHAIHDDDPAAVMEALNEVQDAIAGPAS